MQTGVRYYNQDPMQTASTPDSLIPVDNTDKQFKTTEASPQNHNSATTGRFKLSVVNYMVYKCLIFN